MAEEPINFITRTTSEDDLIDYATTLRMFFTAGAVLDPSVGLTYQSKNGGERRTMEGVVVASTPHQSAAGAYFHTVTACAPFGTFWRLVEKNRATELPQVPPVMHRVLRRALFTHFEKSVSEDGTPRKPPDSLRLTREQFAQAGGRHGRGGLGGRGGGGGLGYPDNGPDADRGDPLVAHNSVFTFAVKGRNITYVPSIPHEFCAADDYVWEYGGVKK